MSRINPDALPNPIDTDHIADAAVTAAKLATDAVETAKIADGAVTSAKLSETYCRWRGASASDPGSAQDGDMYYNTTASEIRQYYNGSWYKSAPAS